jgi:hypothetical protein
VHENKKEVENTKSGSAQAVGCVWKNAVGLTRERESVAVIVWRNGL